MHRLMTDVGASIVASAAMLALTISGGYLLSGTVPPTSTDGERQASIACLERPLVPVRDTHIGSVAQLCLTDGGVRPLVELTDATPGSIYTIWLATTWLAYLDEPALWSGPCASARLAPSSVSTAPARVDGAAADQGGRVLLSHPLPELRLDANSVVELLIVEHASSVLAGGGARIGQPLTWSPAWSDPAGQVPNRGLHQSELVGCASFWIRGGAEQSEH